MLTCAFTGHRNIKEAHKKALPDLLSRAIFYAYEKGCRRFVTGGALGFDTYAAREVLRFRISHPDVSLVLFLPFLLLGSFSHPIIFQKTIIILSHIKIKINRKLFSFFHLISGGKYVIICLL